MKDEFGDVVMREFIGIPPNRYSYLTDDNEVEKKTKNTKKSVINQEM